MMANGNRKILFVIIAVILASMIFAFLFPGSTPEAGLGLGTFEANTRIKVVIPKAWGRLVTVVAEGGDPFPVPVLYFEATDGTIRRLPTLCAPCVRGDVDKVTRIPYKVAD